MKKTIIKAIVGIIIVCIVAGISIFIIDTYTIPITNEVSLSQVNGGSEEYLEMRATNKLIETAQSSIPLIAILLSLIIVALTVRQFLNEKEEGEKAKETKETKEKTK